MWTPYWALDDNTKKRVHELRIKANYKYKKEGQHSIDETYYNKLMSEKLYNTIYNE